MLTIPSGVLPGCFSGALLHRDELTGHVSFRKAPGESRLWLAPQSVPSLLEMIHTLLYLMGPWKLLYVLKRGGDWKQNASGIPGRIQNAWMGDVARSGAGSTLEFQYSEMDSAVSVLSLQQMLGSCIDDDTYAIPDDSTIFLQTGHHGVVELTCMDSSRLEYIIASMAKKGFIVPAEMPDGVFKIPEWMKKRERSA